MRPSRLDRLFDWFIPASLPRGSDAWQRARMFLVSHLFGTPLGHAIMVAVYAVDPAPDAAYWALVGLITAFFALPFLLRWTGRLNLLSAISVLQLAVIVLLASYLYGGVSSPFLPWMVAVPLNAMFYIGTQPRLRVVVLAALAALLVAFFLAYELGGFPTRVPAETLALPGLLSVFCAAAFVSMMALFYALVVSRQQVALEREMAVRQAAEARLRESEASYRLLADNSTDIISRTRFSDGVRTYVSPAAREVLGFEPDELIGRPVSEFAHPEDWPVVRGAARGLSHGEERRTLTYRARRKDGSYVWLEAMLSLVGDAESISVARDITARRAIEDELHQAKLRAEQASRSKSEFLANMSHELRTPLNAIMGFSQIIRSQMLGPAGHPKYAEYGHDIHASGEHLLGLINDILDLAKLEAGRLELALGLVDLPDLLRDCARMLEHAVRQAGLNLRLDVADDLAPIHGDDKRLKQVVLNLLSNAIKFSERGDQVAVEAQAAPDGGLVLKVSDSGIGIAAEHIPLVLEPFGQVQTALARNTDGTGLGLPLAVRLVQMHGGTLTLDSTLGLGTTVTVRLPGAQPMAAVA